LGEEVVDEERSVDEDKLVCFVEEFNVRCGELIGEPRGHGRAVVQRFVSADDHQHGQC